MSEMTEHTEPSERRVGPHRGARLMAEHTAFAYSESVHAHALAPLHISPVDDRGLMLGGGAPAPLCSPLGWTLGGWHIDRRPNRHEGMLRDPKYVCQRCAQAFLDAEVPS